MTSWGEQERLRILHDHGVLDTPPEESFDEIVRAAVDAFGVPIAAVSLVDRNRQWFKARVGLDVAETPRDVSFCAHAIGGDGVMVVPDATKDMRFVDNPLVTDDLTLRFYASAIIRSEEGAPLGTLCVVDKVARPEGLTPEQMSLLQVLADQVSEQLRLRRLVQRQASLIESSLTREDRLRRALELGAVGWWEWDVSTDLVTGNADLCRDFALDPRIATTGAPIEVFFANVHPLDREMLSLAVKDAVETGEPFREEYRIVHPDGRVLWVSARGRCLHDQHGKPACFPGIIIDVTERKETEYRLREADMRRELAMSAAELGSWDHDIASGIRRYDARARQMMGLTIEESADVANSYMVIHPDDRARVEQAAQRAVDPERSGPFRETFRVIDRETGDTRWLSAVGRTEFRNGLCTRFIGVLDDVSEEKRADAHRQLLTNELNHRVKNTLAVVGSIVDASIRSASDLMTARREASNRLMTFGKAHDLLTATSWVSAEVGAVVDSVIEALSLPRDRLDICGGALKLGPRPALQLALALHELATNALKYGALANDTGRIGIDWDVIDKGEPSFHFGWIERGGPPVMPPSRRGFGTRLIEVATAAEFRGTCKMDHAAAGLRWTLDAPLAGSAVGAP
ncbi:PAS domain-containing protein [Sphingomonas sp. MMS24-J13]|uniref:PAS domain-containing protein n=1 Tax=Sphingomonas sp. MMS24-J13 TaxID=3238686 RepID=UPI00384C79A0